MSFLTQFLCQLQILFFLLHQIVFYLTLDRDYPYCGTLINTFSTPIAYKNALLVVFWPFRVSCTYIGVFTIIT